MLSTPVRKITKTLYQLALKYTDIHETAFRTLWPKEGKEAAKGNVLLAYIVQPFLLKEGEPLPVTHTHYLESVLMAEVFLELGYAVDVISYKNTTFKPKKEYQFFISARTNFERIGQRLNRDCIKIVHLDMAHWIFNNWAAYKRCFELKERKQVALPLANRKLQELNWAIECADFATLLGNDFTIETYRYAKKPIYKLHIPSKLLYSWPENKNFDQCRKNYLWFGSHGLIHKGLDLVLDMFKGMPEYHLTVCGPVSSEPLFEKAYYAELYETPNIHTIGWIDISSDRFYELAKKTLGLIYPSASEGQSGAVISCMQTGLIPVISYESGIDVDNFGVMVGDCRIDTLRETIRQLSSKEASELEAMAKTTWETTRRVYTGENYKKKLMSILNGEVEPD